MLSTNVARHDGLWGSCTAWRVTHDSVHSVAADNDHGKSGTEAGQKINAVE
jgi:hypothetical protein